MVHKTLTTHTLLALVLVSLIPSFCLPGASENTRIVVQLIDGSRIFGTPATLSITVKTSYATLELSMDQIRSVSFKRKGTLPVVELRNGDRIQGEVITDDLKLMTLLGTISIPLNTIAVVTALTAAPEIREGLIAYYPLRADASDASGNGRDGVIHGASPAAEVSETDNGAYNFDGEHAYIECQGTNALTFLSGGFTLSAWFSPAGRNEDVVIIAKHIMGHPNGYGLGITGSKCSFYVNSDPRLTDSEALIPSKWYCITGVYDGSKQYLFVNGSLRGSQASPYTNTNQVPVTIGGLPMGGWFSGRISDVRIYSRPLTADEVQALFAEGTMLHN